MTTAPARRRAVLAALGLALVVLLTACMSSGQTAVHNELNADRKAHGLRTLPTHDALNKKAQAWAERMAGSNQLAHSNLADGVGGGWSQLGENVGCGGTVHDVHDGFMNSPTHRAAILGRQFSSVGIGVAERGGKVWVAQVFEG